MLITIITPVATCARCGTQADVRPLQVHRAAAKNDRHPEGFRVVTDDDKIEWCVVSATRPQGWTAWPPDNKDLTSGLCAICDKDWHAAVGDFLVATPSEPEPELEPIFPTPQELKKLPAQRVLSAEKRGPVVQTFTKIEPTPGAALQISPDRKTKENKILVPPAKVQNTGNVSTPSTVKQTSANSASIKAPPSNNAH